MSKSMTAYARVSSPSPLGIFVLEIHSVNRKGLDLSLHLPRDFLRFDIELRKTLSAWIERGQVTLRLSFHAEEMKISSHIDPLRRIKTEWAAVCDALDLDRQQVDLSFLTAQLEPSVALHSPEEEKEFRVCLQAALQKALQDLMQMKQTEGVVLAQDIEGRLHSIEDHLGSVELRKEFPLASYRKKIEERLKEFVAPAPESEERLAREVALLAEKMDITEELVRLRAHITQVRAQLASPLKSVGRTLDFLAQEMHREINTLGAKSQDSEISSLVIQMKSELDRIREQMQNIE